MPGRGSTTLRRSTRDGHILRATTPKGVSPIIGQKTPASSQLHQPSLPQGSGPDWLLSPRAIDKRASHRGGVAVVAVVAVVVVVVRTKCNRSVFVDTTAIKVTPHPSWQSKQLELSAASAPVKTPRACQRRSEHSAKSS